MKVTGETITDEQIRELCGDPGADGDPDFVIRLCNRALDNPAVTRNRERLAAIYNKRFGGAS